MTAIPLARLLVEFGTDADAGQTGMVSMRAADDSAARLAEAEARGREEGRAAAEAQFALQLEAQRQDFAKRLAAERQIWAAQEGEALAGRMLAAMRELEARIGESTARILQPFLAERLRCAAVGELMGLIEAAVAKDRDAALSVRGPNDLIGVLKEKLAGAAINVTFADADAPEVQVTLSDTVLQTRLEAWMARIREAVA